MKTNSRSILIVATALALAAGAANLRATETNAVPRIGIYDSRAVAYAWFNSARRQQELKQQFAAVKTARAAGDTNRLARLGAALRRQQDEIHREVFSTAPAAEALAEIKDRLPEIQKSAGVTALVSQWDRAALHQHPGAGQVDVTGALVREFITPTARQEKTISELQKAKPLPLDECNELIRKNKI